MSLPYRHGVKRQARAAIMYGLLAYVVSVVALATAFDSNPRFYDTEYAVRLATLRARQAEMPDRPLLLAVGSSRMVMSFAPEQLPALVTGAGDAVLPFNFSHIGAGPVLNLTEVARLLSDGVRPRWLFLELMPSQLCHETQFFISQNTTSGDLPVLHPHMGWNRLYGDYLLRRLKSGPKLPVELVTERFPEIRLTRPTEASPLLPLGGCTFLKEDVTPEERIRLTEVTRQHLQEYVAKFTIGARGDGATRALLNMIRDAKIPTAIVLMPEGSMLQGWYAPGARELFDGYCAKLSREYGLPIVDSREWLSDDDMYDEHHALKRGAAAFTARFGREVLTPYLKSGDTSWSSQFGGGSRRIAKNR